MEDQAETDVETEQACITPTYPTLSLYSVAFNNRMGGREHHLSLQKVAGVDNVPPPYNLNIRKGTKNVVLTRKFANFIINDKIAIDLYNFLQLTSIPDEHFYSTLITVQSYDKEVRKSLYG